MSHFKAILHQATRRMIPSVLLSPGRRAVELPCLMKSLASVLVAFIGLAAFAGCGRSVQTSGGMAPTIKSGEKVTIEYTAYIIAKPRRWDVVALKPPNSSSNLVVLKRVIALPTEMISLTTNGIVVNGSLISLPDALTNVALFPLAKLPGSPELGAVKLPYRVPPEYYFVLGDNWANSLDSRYYGAVPAKDIIGKLVSK